MELFSAMRPRQWVKNTLVFAVPLVSGLHVVFSNVQALLAGFAAFSMMASAIYLLNDTIDADRDRLHPTKRGRPVASGRLAPQTAVATSMLLMMSSAIVAWIGVGIAFVVLLASYLVAMLLYVLFLKAVPVADLLILAYGYIVRLLAGAAAVSKTPSPYFFMLVAGVAVLVSAGRRSSELANNQNSAAAHRPVLSQYNMNYLDQVTSVGATLSLVALALWTFDGAERQPFPILAYASLLPAALALLRYLLHVSNRRAESPEALLFSDPLLLSAASVWGLLVSLSATPNSLPHFFS